MKRNVLLVTMILSLLFLLAGCMPGDGSYIDGHYANFISGVWHGWIAPFSLFRGFFNGDIRIYEAYNTGWWYDIGFYMAVISGFGGLSLYRIKKKHN